MPVYVALLRGINVGRNRRMAMADLRALLTEADFADVKTHIASGNVIFSAPEKKAPSVEKALERAVEQRFGFAISVMVRTGSQLAAILDSNPFLDRAADHAHLHVGFLKAEPSTAEVEALGQLDFGPEEFALRGTEVYLYLPDGLGRSKMPTGVFGRALKNTPATVRTWKVVTKLRELAEAAG